MHKGNTMKDKLNQVVEQDLSRDEGIERLLVCLKADQDVSANEEAWSRWYAARFPIKEVTLPKLKVRLLEYRQAQIKQKRRSKAKAKKQQQIGAQDRRGARRTQRLLEGYDGSKLQRLSLLDLVGEAHFSRAYPTLSAPHWEEALLELAIYWAEAELQGTSLNQKARMEDEARVKETLRARFNEDLDAEQRELLLIGLDSRVSGLESQQINKLKLQLQAEALQSYYSDAFLPAWDACLEKYAEICAQRGVDLHKIEAPYAKKIRALLKLNNGRGESSAKRRKGLVELRDALEREIQGHLKEAQEQARLVSTYDEHSDLARYFPKARGIFRSLEFFCGPTNSGKTYAALQILKDSKSGVYLAPLRLLALEVQQSLIGWGTPCSMITGEEQEVIEGAEFVSSTIEMLNFNRVVETAVIDEVQLLGDDRRGWAWTNAVLGVAAERVLFTGSPDALPLVKRLADYLGEPLKVRYFKRFQPLHIHAKHHSLRHGTLKEGTAIVCFSRQDVLMLKRQIEHEMKLPVSVVYGGLSPEVRRIEAQRFRDRESKILVATDAIGMGLNLPIQELLFWKTYKYYDRQEHELRVAEVQQIAGRAGRFGMAEEGYIGAFTGRDLRVLQERYPAKLKDLAPPCFVQPLPFHLEMIAEFLGTEDLVPILRFFQKKIWFSIELFKANITDEMLDLAGQLAPRVTEASLAEKYTFASAPVPMRAARVVRAHLSFAEGALEGEAPFPEALKARRFEGVASDSDALYQAEDAVQIASLYQWLAYRFSEQFTELKEAQACRQAANDYILRSLRAGSVSRRCPSCNKELPFGFRHQRCDDCHYAALH